MMAKDMMFIFHILNIQIFYMAWVDKKEVRWVKTSHQSAKVFQFTDLTLCSDQPL